MSVMALVSIVLMTLGLVLALFIAHRRRHLLAVSGPILLLLLGAWVLAKLASDADYHDADGYVDCWPSCSALQQAVGAALWTGPLVALVVIVAAVASYAARRRRK